MRFYNYDIYMDNTSETSQAVTPEPQVSNINYSPLPPQTPSVKTHEGMEKNIIVVFALLLITLVAAGVLYFYFLKTPKTYNATVYVAPKTAQVIPSPTPTVTQINKNDNSDNALNSDSNVINGDINNANSDLNGVNQSFSDQQTNLQ